MDLKLQDRFSLFSKCSFLSVTSFVMVQPNVVRMQILPSSAPKTKQLTFDPKETLLLKHELKQKQQQIQSLELQMNQIETSLKS